MDYRLILQELYSLESPKIKLGLSRVSKLLERIGNPQRDLKCIHVAGTNGKGSVCAFLHSILKCAGYKTGLYTSPHLKRFNERIKINDKEIPDGDIVRLYKKIKPHIADQSFFEITTAMAFLYFFENDVDIVVLEVGLGGRLDATNVINPLVSIITNLGLEHTEILGDSIEKIAYEKSGIIKKNVPIVCGAKGASKFMIKKYAKRRNALFIPISDEDIRMRFNEKRNSWILDYKKYSNIELTHMKGRYQIRNAAMALEACDILSERHLFNLSNKKMQEGISRAAWPGRMQFRENVLFDCAHNPSGFKMLVQELSFLNCKRLIAVLGFSSDKDIKEISSIVGREFDVIFLTRSNNPKSASIETIGPYFSNSTSIEDPKKALEQAKRIARKEDLILVSGSIYLVGELL